VPASGTPLAETGHFAIIHKRVLWASLVSQGMHVTVGGKATAQTPSLHLAAGACWIQADEVIIRPYLGGRFQMWVNYDTNAAGNACFSWILTKSRISFLALYRPWKRPYAKRER